MKITDLNKDEFIVYAKSLNIWKTTKEPNFLKIKEQILNLLLKHNLTLEDIKPDVRQFHHDVQAYKINK